MPGDAEGSRRNRPYFFLSYAHTPQYEAEAADPNVWVKKLYDSLCSHIMEMTELPKGARVGFLDQGIEVGTRWTDELSENLARCQVFVPLYSPRYFISEQCGREWWAFHQREIHRRARHVEARESAIIPALWVPVEPAQLPKIAKDLQFHHSDFGEDYATEGFYGLIKLSYLNEQYERAVYRLAQRIVRVSRAIGLEEGPIHSDYESLPSAFGDKAHPPRFDVTVIAHCLSDLPAGRIRDYYGDTPADWNPFHPSSSRSLVEHAADLVQSMNYRVTISDFETEADRLLTTDPPTAPALLLLDRWTLESPRVQKLMAQLCKQPRPWISVLVPQYRDDQIPPEREVQLLELTDRILGARKVVGSGYRSRNNGIRSLEAFSVELHKSVSQAVMYYQARAETFPPAPEGQPKDPPWRGRPGYPG
ncbi:TIR-like protein FxsC [Streptomyces griseorubiginosus]|uniref:TIR-like protein FxsC n=1 Tax=Streptomyces griseorubiginosus TaxID=67304 RepID=UPI003699237A